ncbi:MAG: ATP-binding protein [Pseudonocardiaceae bacterium]
MSTELREQAQVVVTELVSNAVEHAGGGIELTVTIRRHVLRLEVSDASDVLPYPLECAVDTLRGHGLRLVAGLTDHWGCKATPNGKIVWADLVFVHSAR